MKMTDFDKLKELLKEPKSIIILPHRNPDGDAIGSTLAMSKYLTKLGHSCEIISPNDFPKFLKWLDGAKDISIAEYMPTRARICVEKEAELIFLLDFNRHDRIDEIGLWLKNTKVPKVMIDHHQEPEQFDFMYSDTQIPATAQMVYNFIEAMGDLDKIDKSMAEAIYTGMMTDTGSFSYKSTKPSTHRIIADLMERGLEIDKIHNQIYNTKSVDRVKLLAVVLDSLKALPDYRTAFMHLSRQQQLDHNTQKGDTEGMVNYGLSLADYVFSVIFIEDQVHDFIKISFRSKGDFDVNAFARKHFNGGGHINAAGGRSDVSMEATIEKFEEVLKEYREELKNVVI